MKTQHLRHLVDLLASETFHGWFRDYNALRREREECQERHQELLTQANMVAFKSEATQRAADDMLFRAGELEMEQANALAQFNAIENDSFEMLSAFEMQRQRTTEGWEELQRAEAMVEDERQKAGEVRARMEAARKIMNTPESAAQAQRLGVRLKELEQSISQYSQQAIVARSNLDESMARKEQLWLQVEDAWSRSFEANMRRSEYGFQVRRARGDAEALFQKSMAERRRVDELQRDAEQMKQRIGELERDYEHILSRARERFGCSLVNEFMCWPQENNMGLVYCVPLIDEKKYFNIELSALLIYQMESAKGLDFIEPVAPDDETVSGNSQLDSRLDAFFLEGRPQAPRAIH